MQNKKSHKVAIVMGSQSDYSTMKYTVKVLKILKIKYETIIVSAHRTPNRMYDFAKKAEKNDFFQIRSVPPGGGAVGPKGQKLSQRLKPFPLCVSRPWF